MATSNEDINTAPRNNPTLIFEVPLNAFSIFVFIFDIGSDAVLAYSFYTDGETLYFYLTLASILVAALTMNIVSISFYATNDNNLLWLKCVFHLLLLGPLYRYIENQYDACTRKAKTLSPENALNIIRKHHDITVLNILESFLESAPQVVLQLYILITNTQHIRPDFQTGSLLGLTNIRLNTTLVDSNHDLFGELTKFTVIFQCISIYASLLSIAWSLTRNARYLRLTGDHKPMSFLGSVFHFLWHFCMVGSRVLAVAVFTAVFPYWCPIPLVFRCIVISIWLCELHKGQNNSCYNVFKHVCHATLYLFAFVYVYVEPTLPQYLLYYAYEMFEDAILVGVWWWVVDPMATWYFFIVLLGYFSAGVTGFLFMLIYQIGFYPGRPKKNDYSFKQHDKSELTVSDAVELRSSQAVFTISSDVLP